jgi:hypothetical protein
MRKIAAFGATVALTGAMLTSAAVLPAASAATCTPHTWLEKPALTDQVGGWKLTAHFQTCGQSMTLTFKSRIYHEGRYEAFARYYNLVGKDVTTIGMAGCGGTAVKGQYETTLKVGQTLIATSAPVTFTPPAPPCG